MNSYENVYQGALLDVEVAITQALTDVEISMPSDVSLVEKSTGTLDAWDYCYAVAIGMAGVFISTNEAFGEYLDQIHKAASGASGEYDKFQSFLGDKLSHHGDYIDMIERPFKNRNGGNAYCIFHRLLWGHDVLSIGEDNPFVLMFNQQGMAGILQAVRHLLADTASKQGLPLPGSSYLDIVDENNKTSNYLIMVAQQLSEESTGLKSNAQEIFSHMMTIRTQDITAGVVVKLVTELYFLIRRIDDKIRRAEIRLIAYTVNFLGEAVVGCVRQNGVPYINLPLAGAMATSFARLCYLDSKEVRSLAAKTEMVHDQVDALEKQATLQVVLPEMACADDYIRAADTADAAAEELLIFFGEEEAE